MKTHEKKTLAMCIRCKDDADCLKENIEYHTLIGVEHFFIYDNMSAVPLKEVLADYDNVTVEINDNWNDCSCQGGCHLCLGRDLSACYHKCWRENKNKFQWIAFIDTDEFIVMKDGNTDLKQFLKPYEKSGGLIVWWRNFGSSGHKRKQKSVIQSYTAARLAYGPCFKTILNTQFGQPKLNPSDVHHCRYNSGKGAVDEQHVEALISLYPNGRQWNKMNAEKIQINHYLTRSEEDFENKIKRWRSIPERASLMERPGNHLKNSLKLNDIIDTTIIDLLNKIKNQGG